MSSVNIDNQTCPHCGKAMKQIEHTVDLGSGQMLTLKGNWTCHCKGAEQERIERIAEANRKMEEEAIEQVKAKCLRYGVKRHFLGSKAGKEYVEQVKDGKSLYIVGKTGVGKTYLASGIAKRLVLLGKHIRFTSLLGILEEVKGSFGSRGEREIIGLYRSCDVLFLDDLGQETVTPWMLEQLYYIVNSRYEDDKPIVVTSQFERDSLARRLAVKGENEKAAAIVRRLSDMCGEVIRL